MSNSLKGYIRSGEFYVWLTAGALAVSLVLLTGLLLLISINGFAGFWPGTIHELILEDDSKVLGEIQEIDSESNRIKIKQGNRDLYGLDFRWLESSAIVKKSIPYEPVSIERYEWGVFYGYPTALQISDKRIKASDPSFKKTLAAKQEMTHETLAAIESLEKNEIREIAVRQNYVLNRLQNLSAAAAENSAEIATLTAEREKLEGEFQVLEKDRMALKDKLNTSFVVTSVDGQEKAIPLEMIHRITQTNSLSLVGKIGVYVSRGWDFIWEDPREANTEGGVFPAIFGTIMMVLIMSVVVTPLGVLAAVYLHEYAKPGPMVTLVRIAVNNLAGVPSIVFGVFGVGFFIYGIGSGIDELFFAESLPSPTFGTGGILWASLTLALLTVPTVIVATEEGLSALPKHWREASYALGATKYETMRRVVIPALTPAILTGAILATARAAGEVAPLMITGVVKMAPTLPLDGTFPFFHMDRKFMHLGFHIYDLGFQSPNVDASRPMVYATTLLLLFLVIGLNSAAIVIRNRLNKKIHVGTI